MTKLADMQKQYLALSGDAATCHLEAQRIMRQIADLRDFLRRLRQQKGQQAADSITAVERAIAEAEDEYRQAETDRAKTRAKAEMLHASVWAEALGTEARQHGIGPVFDEVG